MDRISAEGGPRLTHPTERRHPRHPEGQRVDHGQLAMSFGSPVFSTPTRDLLGMVRGDSPMTSQAAAVSLLPKLSKLQAQVLAVVDGLTDRELERLECFALYAPSTVRKRRSECLALGLLRPDGERDGLTVWAVVK